MLELLIGALLGGMSLGSCDFNSTTVNLTVEDFRFSPAQFELPAHEIIRMNIRNQGRERHIFQSPILTYPTVRVLENSSTGTWQRGDAIRLEPGQRVELSLDLSPGLYSFRCQIRGHGGMEGRLIVRE